ncbi:MAG: glycosyltransferase family 2 protein [Anaerolineae bacterium]|nr:glycosyltransferase family 2 protein [Anaerolineae bacterium]
MSQGIGELLASVVIINYNMAPLVPDCLASLCDQEMPGGSYEVIFADNASTDGSVARASEFAPLVRIVRLERNYGFSAGNNRALVHTRGRYVVFLNADTVAHRRWLPELVAAMQANPRLGGCSANMIMPWVPEFARFDREMLPEHLYYYDLSRYGFTRYRAEPFSPEPRRSLFLSGASLMLDAALLSRLGPPFDAEHFPYGEDIDLSLRINGLGYDTAIIPPSVLYHRDSFATKLRPNRKSVTRAARLTAGRVLAYYKNMTAREFLLFLPWLLAGAPLKLTELGWQRERQMRYLLPSIGVALLGEAWALLNVPRLRARRRETLAQRQRDATWFWRHITRDLRPPLEGYGQPLPPTPFPARV